MLLASDRLNAGAVCGGIFIVASKALARTGTTAFIVCLTLVWESHASPNLCGPADDLTLADQDFLDDEFLACAASNSINLGGNAGLYPGTELVLRAPVIRIHPPVSVETGAILSAARGNCGDLFTFEAGKAPAQEIHVATGGIDMPGCGSEVSPCANIEYAATGAQPATAIIVHAGTYAGDQFISDLSGTARQPIWIGGAAGEARPVIDGGSEGMHLSRVRYLILHDLEVRNSADNGINTDDGEAFSDKDATRYLVFRRLHIHDIGGSGNQDCLKLSGVDDYWITDNEFSYCGGGLSGSAIDQVGCHNGIIKGNYFHDLTDSGSGVQGKGGSRNLEIRANLFENAGSRAVNMGGSTGFTFFRPPLSTTSPNAEARDIRVIANVFRGSRAPVAFTGCVDCLVANNTIDTPERWVFRILQETTSSGDFEFLPTGNGDFSNNIIHFDDQLATAVNIGPDTDPLSFTIRTNLWYRYDDPAQSDPPGGLPVVEQAPITGADPEFADPGSGDFRIDSDSPAYVSGTPISELSADFEGLCYPPAPSRGALEVP